MNKYKLCIYLFWLVLYALVVWGVIPAMISYKEGFSYLHSVGVAHCISSIVYIGTNLMLLIVDVYGLLSDKAKQVEGDL